MSKSKVTQLRNALSGMYSGTFAKYNAHSIGIGLKEVGGRTTDELCIVFGVNTKKDTNNLSNSEIIPGDLSRWGIDAATDVIQCDENKIENLGLQHYEKLDTGLVSNSIYTAEEIEASHSDEVLTTDVPDYFGIYNFTPDFNTNVLNFDTQNYQPANADSLTVDYFHEPEIDDPVVGLHRGVIRPLSGGISSIYTKSGGTATLGMVVKDSTDGQPVLLSNNHVYAASQFVGIEGNVYSDYSNTFAMSARQPGYGDILGGVYQGVGSRSPNAAMSRDHIGFAKRCVPLRKDGDNYVDAALMSVSGLHNLQDDHASNTPGVNPTHGYGSSNILHLAQQGPYEFATEAEIDGLIDPASPHFLAPVFRSGRTLGPLGYPGSTESKTITRELNFDSSYTYLSSSTDGSTDLHTQGTDRIVQAKFINHIHGGAMATIQPGYGDSIHIHSDANDVFVGGFQKAADYWYRFTNLRNISLYPGSQDWKSASYYTQLPGKFYGPDDKTRIAVGNSNTYGVSGTGDQTSSLSGKLVYYGSGSFSDRQVFFTIGGSRDYIPGLVPALSSTQGSSEYQAWPVQPNLITPACTGTIIDGFDVVGEFNTGGHTNGLPLIHIRAQTWNAGGGSPVNKIPSAFNSTDLIANENGVDTEAYPYPGDNVQPTWGAANVEFKAGGVYPPWVVHAIDRSLSGDYFKAADNMYVKTPSAGNVSGMEIKNQPFLYRHNPKDASDRSLEILGDNDGRLIRATFKSGWVLYAHIPFDVASDTEPNASNQTGGAYRSSNMRKGLDTARPLLKTSGYYAFNPSYVGDKGAFGDFPVYFDLSTVQSGPAAGRDMPGELDILQSLEKSNSTANPGGPFNHEFVPLSAGGAGFILDVSVHKDRLTSEGPAVDRMDPSKIKILNGNYHDTSWGVSSILSGNKIYSIGTNHLYSTIMDSKEKGSVHRVWTQVPGSYKDAYSYGLGGIFALNESTHKVHFSSTHYVSGGTNLTNHMSSRVNNAYALENNYINYLGTYRKLYIEGESFSWFYGQTMDNSIRFVFARGGWDPIAFAKREEGTAFINLSTFNQDTECFSTFKHGYNHLINENGTVWYASIIGMTEKAVTQAVSNTHSMFFNGLKTLPRAGTGWFTCEKLHTNIDAIDGHAHTIDFQERKIYGKDSIAFLSGGNWFKSGKNIDNFMATTSAYKDDVIVTAAGLNVNVNFGTQGIITFRDCLAIRSKHKHFPVTQGGDSGSAVLALFNRYNPDPGTPTYDASIHTALSGWKVIGLVYAGPRPTNSAPGIVCRIDRIVDQLGIESWDGVIPSDVIRNRQVSHTTDLQTPMTLTLSGRKFYNVGGIAKEPAAATIIS